MFSRLKTLLGVFQSSHYDTVLFRAWLARHHRAQDWDRFRGKAPVVWSLKAKLLFISSITFSPLIPWALVWNYRVLQPVEWVATQWLKFLARRHLSAIRPRMIIGITGSFGKTTTKEIFAQILGQKFRVHKTPENVNTLLGIAQWIKQAPFGDGDVVIVEMGAYGRGDIKKLCGLARPTAGVLTGLNEAHRERFGSLEETAAAKCELFDALPPAGLGLWNKDSLVLNQAVSKRINQWQGRGLRLTGYNRSGADAIKIEILAVKERGTRLRIVKTGQANWTWEGEIALLGAHVSLPLAAGISIASTLGMSREEIVRGLGHIRPLQRRLNPIPSPGDRLVIDDSYNITLDGVRAAFEFLVSVKRRKIGVFAGIPEAGPDSAAVNTELGRRIAEVFDLALLRDTPVRAAVEKGLQEQGFPGESIIRYIETQEVEQILSRVVRNGDCVYFSAYDWPVIYL